MKPITYKSTNETYQDIARKLDALIRCEKTGNAYASQHEEAINAIIKDYLPSGSGFDNGTKLDFDKSTPQKLVLHTAFHHMDENGYYDGWSEHTITVKPCLMFGFSIGISGRDRNGIKEYMHERFANLV